MINSHLYVVFRSFIHINSLKHFHFKNKADQILTEYKKRVISCHPDKNPDDSTAHERFELLKVAKETLTDSTIRTKYDQWLNSGICMSWKDWSHRSDSHQPVSFKFNKYFKSIITFKN